MARHEDLHRARRECFEEVGAARAEWAQANREFVQRVAGFLERQHVRRKRVLIVEDDAASMTLILLALRDEPLEIAQTTTGKAAIRILQSGQYDAAVVDICLPDISGPEIIEAIRNRTLSPLIPVIAITAAEDTTEAQAAAVISGAHVLLSKVPFSTFAPRLVSELRRLLQLPIDVSDREHRFVSQP